MAENNNATNNVANENGASAPDNATENKKPTYEELEAMLNSEKAERTKIKNAFDKTASELSATKKSLKDKMTADEQALEAQKERDEYVKGLEKQIALNNATTKYLGMGMDAKLASATAQAEIDNDFTVVADNFNKFKEQAIKDAQAEWLRNRPPVNAGTGSNTITKEQFESMSLEKRSELYRTNKAEYDRLIKL